MRYRCGKGARGRKQIHARSTVRSSPVAATEIYFGCSPARMRHGDFSKAAISARPTVKMIKNVAGSKKRADPSGQRVFASRSDSTVMCCCGFGSRINRRQIITSTRHEQESTAATTHVTQIKQQVVVLLIRRRAHLAVGDSAPMTEIDSYDNKISVLNIADNSVITDPVTPVPFERAVRGFPLLRGSSSSAIVRRAARSVRTT